MYRTDISSRLPQLIQNTQALGVNPRRMFIGGGSAGANIASISPIVSRLGYPTLVCSCDANLLTSQRLLPRWPEMKAYLGSLGRF